MKTMSSQIRLTVKFFASARDAVGQKKVEIEVDKNMTVEKLLEYLMEKYSGLDDLKKQIIIAVNKDTVPKNRRLENGDEVAVLPPVSGG